MSTFQIGDRVLISRRITPQEEKRWSNCWCRDMDNKIGLESFIISIQPTGIELQGIGYYWPPCVLYKVDTYKGYRKWAKENL